MRANFPVVFSNTPFWINPKFVFLGEIPRNSSIDSEDCFGQIEKNGQVSADHILDDSALVYKSPQGLIIFTGCSHSGICNIVEYAKRIADNHRILDIIGGFHLKTAAQDRLSRVIEYMQRSAPLVLHACHCTGEGRAVFPIQENVGIGRVIEYSFNDVSSVHAPVSK